MRFFGYNASAALPQRRRKPMTGAARTLVTTRECLEISLRAVEERLAVARNAGTLEDLSSAMLSLGLAFDRAQRRGHELEALYTAFRELGLLDPDLTERQNEEA